MVEDNVVQSDLNQTGDPQWLDITDAESESRVGYESVYYWPTLRHPLTFGDAANVAVGPDNTVNFYCRGPWMLLSIDESGSAVRAWEQMDDVDAEAHGIGVDPDGNLYFVDRGRHCIEKRSPEGKLLMTIGTPGVASEAYSNEPFNQPTDVAVDPETGDIFVADGYQNSCVHRYDENGKLIKTWGSTGSDPGYLSLVHGICLYEGYVVVCDSANYRVQFFTYEGEYVKELHVHHPLSICAGGPDNLLFVAEAHAQPPALMRNTPGLGNSIIAFDAEGRKVGRFGGSAGKGTGPNQIIAPHGISVDREGNIYVAELGTLGLKVVLDEPTPTGEVRTVRKFARTLE